MITKSVYWRSGGKGEKNEGLLYPTLSDLPTIPQKGRRNSAQFPFNELKA